MSRQSGISTTLVLLAIALAGATGLLFAGCGGGGGNGTAAATGGESAASAGNRYAGLAVTPAKPAPPLQLRDYRGRPVDLKDYRGDAVLVTFIYTHCPDVCPLIVSHMKTAQALLGAKADGLQIVAVSTDPRGDTPRTVSRFLQEHAMRGRMEYLIGSKPELGRVWKNWGIVAAPAKSGRDLVEHSAMIYGIDAGGMIRTLYPANFRPAQLVHDVPLLEAQ